MEASRPPPPDAPLISNDSQESGLWLWRGEAPSPRPAPPVRPSSRLERVASLFISAARSAGWMGPPSGLALVALAAFVTAHLLPGGQAMPGTTSAAALQSMPAPSLAHSISPAPPAPLIEAPVDRVQAPSAPVRQAMVGPTLHKPVRWRARHTIRRSHVLFARRWTPVFIQPCRYECDWAQGTAWHGGGD
jgi:hypothetical protein